MNDFKNIPTQSTEAALHEDCGTGNTPEEDLAMMYALTMGTAIDMGNGLYAIPDDVAAALLDGQKKRYFNG